MPLNVFTPLTLIEAEKLNENFTFVQASLTGLTDIAVTGAVTIASSALSAGPATLRWHVCAGTAANYSVTLPAVSGNAGKYFATRMALGLTKLVTLKGNASENIDGSNARVMWAGESAVLYCDGTAWFKVEGKSIAMVCRMILGAAQSIPGGTQTKVLVNTADIAGASGMADATNRRINIVRPGNYRAKASFAFNLTAALSSPTMFGIYLNVGGNELVRDEMMQGVTTGAVNVGNYVIKPVADGIKTCVLSDYVEFTVFTYGAGPYAAGQYSAYTFLEVHELSPW